MKNRVMVSQRAATHLHCITSQSQIEFSNLHSYLTRSLKSGSCVFRIKLLQPTAPVPPTNKSFCTINGLQIMGTRMQHALWRTCYLTGSNEITQLLYNICCVLLMLATLMRWRTWGTCMRMDWQWIRIIPRHGGGFGGLLRGGMLLDFLGLGFCI